MKKTRYTLTIESPDEFELPNAHAMESLVLDFIIDQAFKQAHQDIDEYEYVVDLIKVEE